MESHWLMLIAATIIMPIAMFYIGFWLEGQSGVVKDSARDSDTTKE